METIKDFWEDAHTTNNQLWLTGSYLYQVWGPMMILNQIRLGLKVLNIGVGFGRDTVDLNNRDVKCKDISQHSNKMVLYTHKEELK